MEIFSLSGDFRMEGDSSASMEAMMGFSGFGECFSKTEPIFIETCELHFS